MKIWMTNVDISQSDATELASWSVRVVDGFVGDQEPFDEMLTINMEVGNAQPTWYNWHCNFAGTDCWELRTHPTITEVFNHVGFSSGSQTIEIYGFGFDWDLNYVVLEIEINNWPCTITDWGFDGQEPDTLQGNPTKVDQNGDPAYGQWLTCTTAPGTTTVEEREQPGSHGVNYSKYSSH